MSIWQFPDFRVQPGSHCGRPKWHYKSLKHFSKVSVGCKILCRNVGESQNTILPGPRYYIRTWPFPFPLHSLVRVDTVNKDRKWQNKGSNELHPEEWLNVAMGPPAFWQSCQRTKGACLWLGGNFLQPGWRHLLSLSIWRGKPFMIKTT